MNFMYAPDRPAWLDVAIAFIVGVVGQTIIGRAFPASDGSLGPIAGLLLPGAIGVTAGLVTHRGSALAGLVVGVVLGFQAAALIAAGSESADVVTVALATGAAALGFIAVYGLRMSTTAQGFKPPSPLDRERVKAELTAQLRSIDPAAPGSFERAVTVLRQVNEQLQLYGPYSPWQVGADTTASTTPADLLQVQAELVEAARVSAMAAGARRVTITSSGMGLEVQAIFGDPIVGETERPGEGMSPYG